MQRQENLLRLVKVKALCSTCPKVDHHSTSCAVEQNNSYQLSAALRMPCVPSSYQIAAFVFGNRRVGSDTTVHNSTRHAFTIQPNFFKFRQISVANFSSSTSS
jgi:hypothetical protein